MVDAINENPPPKDQIDAVLPQYKYLGIELGKPWKPENVLNSIFLEEMKKVGAEIGPMIASCPYLIGPNGNGWIVTMYDLNTKLTVENPINRYVLGSDDPLKKNSDGSITIYLQNSSPGKDKESNWLSVKRPMKTASRLSSPKSLMLIFSYINRV